MLWNYYILQGYQSKKNWIQYFTYDFYGHLRGWSYMSDVTLVANFWLVKLMVLQLTIIVIHSYTPAHNLKTYFRIITTTTTTNNNNKNNTYIHTKKIIIKYLN